MLVAKKFTYLLSAEQKKWKILLKGDKEKNVKRQMLLPFHHVMFQCLSQNCHLQPTCDSPGISLIPLPSVWLDWPWSPKSRSSPLKIRLLISPPVECVMPMHGNPLSHIGLPVITYCLLFSWPIENAKEHIRMSLETVSDTLLNSGLSMYECACICFWRSECSLNQNKTIKAYLFIPLTKLTFILTQQLNVPLC